MPDSKRPDPQVFRFLNEIGIIGQLANSRVEKSLPFGLKLSQFAVLNHFVRLGGEWSPSRLADAFQVTRGAMTNTVNRLQEKDFVVVSVAESDGRGKRIAITAKGRRAQEQCVAAMAPDLLLLQRAFSADKFAAAVPFLEQVRSFLDENRSLDR